MLDSENNLRNKILIKNKLTYLYLLIIHSHLNKHKRYKKHLIMKRFILLSLVAGLSLLGYAQDQIINGNLTVYGALETSSSVSVGRDNGNVWGEGPRLYLRGIDPSNDPVWLAKYTAVKERTDLRVNVGDGYDTKDRFVVGTTDWETKKWEDKFVVKMCGRVGIGVSDPQQKLEVDGTIRAKGVILEATEWSDFVFAEDYKLPILSEVENHIKEHKHLPDLPSEKQVFEEGINVIEMQAKLLQKIEELTLYVIDQQKEINGLKQELKKLKKE